MTTSKPKLQNPYDKYCRIKTPTKEKPVGYCWGIIKDGKCMICGAKHDKIYKMTRK